MSRKIRSVSDFQKPKRKLGKVYPTNETVIKSAVSKSIQMSTQTGLLMHNSQLNNVDNHSVRLDLLLTKLKHYKMHARKDSICQLHNTILSSMNEADWSRHGTILLPPILKLLLDPEREIRLYMLQNILKPSVFPFYPNIMSQFSNWIVTILSLGLTHLQQDISQDTVLYVQIFMQYVPTAFKPNHYIDLFQKMKVSVLERYQQHQLSHKTKLCILECMKQFVSYRIYASNSTINNTELTTFVVSWMPNMRPLNIFSTSLDTLPLYDSVPMSQQCILKRASDDACDDTISFAPISKESHWMQDLRTICQINDLHLLLSHFVKEMFVSSVNK